VAVGVAFVVLMPVVGLFLCLCRCAGHCGAKRRYDDVPSKRDRCRRVSCGLLLLILATLITYVSPSYLFIEKVSCNFHYAFTYSVFVSM